MLPPLFCAEGAMRINKYLSEAGICSRRAADREIQSGAVTINDRIAVPGDTVSETDVVKYKGAVVEPLKNKVVLAYYKPLGVVCTEAKEEKDSFLNAIDYPRRVTYLGRLDKNSEGLLLLSDDGDLAEKLMRGKNRHEKEYEVEINREVTADFLRKLCAGVYLPELSVKTRPCQAKKLGAKTFSIVLTQGLNRQIRRMCEALGVRVVSLKRVRIENILLSDMRPGDLRELTPEEERVLRQIAEKRKDHE